MSLSTSEIEQFTTEGYVVKRGVYSAEDQRPLRAGMTALIDAEARRLQAGGELLEIFEHEDFAHRLACIAERYPAAAKAIYWKIIGKAGGGYSGEPMYNLLTHAPLLDCVESLVGPEIIASSVYRIRPKMPHFAHGEVPWHQDQGYLLAHCDRHLIVTCWVPLVDATLQNGCLWVLPRHHRSGIVRHHTGGRENYLVIKPEDLPAGEAVPVEMQAGDVLFMTNFTPHCSQANTSGVVRWSVDLRYQSAAAPTNAGEAPEDFNPEKDPVEMACYPPEADFVVRSRAHPEKVVPNAAAFDALRQSYERATHIPYPGRGWQPVTAD